MPVLEDFPKPKPMSRPTAEEFMRGVAASRGLSVDASNAADFLKGIVYMVIEHDLRPPELGDRSSAGENIIPSQAVLCPKDMIG